MAQIALDQYGVADNPPETAFPPYEPDCNPYAALLGVGSSCGGPSSSPFTVTNNNQEWCADLTKWVWRQAGITADLSTLDANAGSFYTWAQQQGQSLPLDPTTAQPGDAVVIFSGAPGTADSDHVGTYLGATSRGPDTLINGDFLGSSNISVQEDGYSSLAQFADQYSDPEWFVVSPPSSPAPPPSGTNDVFVRSGSGGQLDAYKYDTSTGARAAQDWTAASKGGVAMTGDPDIIVDGSNIDAFVESATKGQLDEYQFNTTTSAWSAAEDWTAATKGGVPMTGTPHAVVNGDTIDVFVQSATDGQLDEYQYNTTNGDRDAQDWTAATKGGVPMTGDPDVIVNGSDIDAFVQSATKGQLDEYQYNTTNGDRDAQDWTAATKGGVPMTGDPDVIVNGSDIDAFVQSATKGQLDEYQYNTTNGDRDAQDWTAATKGGVPMTGDPDVIVNGSDIDAFVQSATDGQLDEYQYNTTNGDRDAQDWTAATKGGVPMTGNPSAVVAGQDIDTFVQSATDGQLDEYQYNTTNGDRDAQDWTAATKGGVPMTGDPAANTY